MLFWVVLVFLFALWAGTHGIGWDYFLEMKGANYRAPEPPADVISRLADTTTHPVELVPGNQTRSAKSH